MEKQQQDSNVSQLSLDERFSDKGRRSSARLRHQSLDRDMDRPSLNRRVGGKEEKQLPMTAPHCRWIQASSAERQPLDQRFGSGDYRLRATELHHLRTAVEQQDKGDSLQRPTTATTSVGQQEREPTVAALHSCTGHQTSSSHGTSVSTNVEGWTSDEHQQSSIYESAGAQLWNTDKASKTEMELKSAAHDARATTSAGAATETTWWWSTSVRTARSPSVRRQGSGGHTTLRRTR